MRFTHRYEFEISTEPRTLDNTDEIIPRYAAVKQHIVVILNSHFPHWMGRRFRLKHWLQRKKHDELAYFLNEGMFRGYDSEKVVMIYIEGLIFAILAHRKKGFPSRKSGKARLRIPPLVELRCCDWAQSAAANLGF